MTHPVYMQRLGKQYGKTLKKVRGWTPGDESVELKPIIVAKFEKGYDLLTTHSEAAADENLEADQADEALVLLAADSVPLFERMYHALVARFHEAKAEGNAANQSHTTDLDRFLVGYSPAQYRDATPDTQTAVLGEAVRLADHFLTGKWQSLADEAADLHAQMVVASESADKEQGEADEADVALVAAYDKSRDFYIAARDLLRGALRMDGVLELLDKWAPAITRVIKPGTGSGSTEPAEPTPQPDPQPEPM